MSRSKNLLKLGLVAVATTALALSATVSVSAHTGSLFTVVDGPDGGSSFATVSGTDASLTAFGEIFDVTVRGIEISGEDGYALLDTEIPSIVPWNHTSGAFGTPVDLTAIDGFSIFGDVRELDTTADGTILAFAMLQSDAGGGILTVQWVVSIDPATGVVTPEVSLFDTGQHFDSLATFGGTTYAFVTQGEPRFITLDLGTGAHGALSSLTGITSALGVGEFAGGADFDTNGTLWFFYNTIEARLLASTTGAFGPTVGAVVSGALSDSAQTFNLAYDVGDAPIAGPAAAPVLPHTGVDAFALAGGAVALFAAGLVVLFIVRRRTA